MNWKHGIRAGLLLCLLTTTAAAQESTSPFSDDPGQGTIGSDFSPFSILPQNANGGLAFDLAGSETRKLQLQLADPLTLSATSGSRWLNLGSGSLLAGTALQWTASENLDFNAGVEQSQIQFQPLGSIHCQNGILGASSYRASDCYFTNEPETFSLGTISIGADYELGNRAMAAINLFRQEATLDTRIAGRQSFQGGAPVLGAGLLSPVLSNPLLGQASGGQTLEYLDSEVTGIDLEFKVGLSTDNAGDMQMGLQFTRILDGSYHGLFPSGSSLANWTVAESFDSAKVSFDWQRNSFSGGIQGFYREPVEFLNRSKLESFATFDVYFTWRTPWNGSLSVGASNLLNSGVDETGSSENTVSDPFESVYGRIPYVRYQQDL